MAEYPVRRPLRRPPSHPGVLMREILEAHLNLSVAAAARRMRVSRQSLHAVLAGKAAVSADMALRFARLAGSSPDLFLHMQSGFDLWQAEQRLRDILPAIEPAAA